VAGTLRQRSRNPFFFHPRIRRNGFQAREDIRNSVPYHFYESINGTDHNKVVPKAATAHQVLRQSVAMVFARNG
jgi:hypothetical protein